MQFPGFWRFLYLESSSNNHLHPLCLKGTLYVMSILSLLVCFLSPSTCYYLLVYFPIMDTWKWHPIWYCAVWGLHAISVDSLFIIMRCHSLFLVTFPCYALFFIWYSYIHSCSPLICVHKLLAYFYFQSIYIVMLEMISHGDHIVGPIGLNNEFWEVYVLITGFFESYHSWQKRLCRCN